MLQISYCINFLIKTYISQISLPHQTDIVSLLLSLFNHEQCRSGGMASAGVIIIINNIILL